jgi:hypothetical protein
MNSKQNNNTQIKKKNEKDTGHNDYAYDSRQDDYIRRYETILDNVIQLNCEFNHLVQNSYTQKIFNLTSVPFITMTQVTHNIPSFHARLIIHNPKQKVFEEIAYSKANARNIVLKKFFLYLINKQYHEENLKPQFDKIVVDIVDMQDVNNKFNNLSQDKEKLLQLKLEILSFKYQMLYSRDYECSLKYIIDENEKIAKGIGGSKSAAKTNAIKSFFKSLNMDSMYVVSGQMDDTTVVGVAEAVSSQEKETIVTTDTIIASTLPAINNPEILANVSSAGIVSKFEDLTSRWLILDQDKLVANTERTGIPWRTYEFPTLFLDHLRAPNVLVMKQYKLIRPEYEVKVKFNSNKFNQGKIVVSYLLQGKQIQTNLSTLPGCYSSYRSLKQSLQRDHVIIDLNESNEALLKIPFVNTNNFVPMFDKVDEEIYSNVVVDIHILSPLKVPDEAQQYVNFVVMGRMIDTGFTALRPAVDNVRSATGQMDLVTGLLGAVAAPVLDVGMNLVSGVIGQGVGLVNDLLSPVVGLLNPQRRSTGIETMFGNIPNIPSLDKPADHSQPVEFRPNAVGDTSVAVRSEPKLSMRLDSTVLTPSMSLHFPGKNPVSISELTQIWSWVGNFNWTTAQQTPGEEIFSIVTQPNLDIQSFIGYFSNMYSMYSGSIEFRFDIVGTSFHTGSIGIGWIPFQDSFTEEEARCSYFKYHDMREQKQITFNVPYIDTNVLRIIPNKKVAEQTFVSPGSLKVFVENALVPIGSVTPSVEILVFMRAGPDFHFTGLQDPELYIATGQMDTGEKENVDTTDLFGTLPVSGVAVNIGEDHEMIPDILKRWVKIDTQTINSEYIRNLNYPFPRGVSSNPSEMVANCFRYKRGGECFMFVFEQIDSVRLNDQVDDVTIQPMQDVRYNAPANVPVPTSIGAYNVVPLPELPTNINLQVPSQTSTPYWASQSNTDFLHVDTRGSDKLTPVHQFTGPASERPITNEILNLPIADITTNRNKISDNNIAINDYAAKNTNNSTLCNANLDGISKALNTNVGINVFNTAVETSLNSVTGQLTSMTNQINENSRSTNSNNVNIVNAIDGGSSGIISATTPATIEITYQSPNNQSLNQTVQSFKGLPSQIICTDINRTCKMYIPYYSIFNYQSWFSNSNKNKEKLSTTLGRVLITATKPVKVHIYWSAGDDMYFNKVIGVPNAYHSLRSTGQMDQDVKQEQEVKYDIETIYHASGQGDDFEPIPSTSGQTLDALLLNKKSAWSDFTRHPIDAGYACFNRGYNKVAQPFRNINEASKVINNLSNKATEIMDNITSCATAIIDYLKSKFSWITQTGPIFQTLLHLLQTFINPTLPTVIISVIGVITSLGLLSIEATSKLINFFKNNIKTNSTQEQQTGENGVKVSGQCNHDCVDCEKFVNCEKKCVRCDKERPLFDQEAAATLGSLVIGAIGASFGLKNLPSGTGLCTGLFKISQNFWTTITHSVRFLRDFIALCMRAFRRLGRADPCVRESMLMSGEIKGVKEFVTEAQLMTSQMNRASILQLPEMKKRFWLCATKAYSIQAQLSTRSTRDSMNLNRLCERVIKLANELSVQLTNCPVRYEPFVLALKGESQVGKSFLMNSIIPEMLADTGDRDSENNLTSLPGLGVTYHGNPIYTRTPGVQFWNGYTNQPAILYDDYLASTEPTMAAISVVELFNLKSSAVMNCNMADLNEKSLQANPFIVALAMNKVVVPNGVTEPEAFKRRKDIFWEVRNKRVKINGIEKVYKRTEFNTEEQRKFDHLEFAEYTNVTDASTLGEWMDYQSFKKRNLEAVRLYHDQEKKNVAFRFEKLKIVLPKTAQTMMDETDPFKIFYSAYIEAADQTPVQTGFLPTEVLQQQLNGVLNALNVEQPVDGQLDFSEVYNRVKNKIKNVPSSIKQKMVRYITGSNYFTQPLMGHCFVCQNGVELDEEPIEADFFCVNSEKHIMCRQCAMASHEANPEQSMRCGLCRGQMLSCVYNMPATFDLIKQMGRNIVNKVPGPRQILKSKWFWCGFTAVAYYIFLIIFSAQAAQINYDNDKFLCKLFDIPFEGEIIKSTFGITLYYPNGQMDLPQISSNDVIEPTIKKTEFNHFWRTQNFKAEEIITGNCPHVLLTRTHMGQIDYEWDRTLGKPYGHWLVGISHTMVTDNKCASPECKFDNEFRKIFIESWEKEKATFIAYQLQGNQANNNKFFVPPDFINPNYLQAQDQEIVELCESVRNSLKVSFIDKLKGFWHDYGKVIKIGMAFITSILAILSGWKFISGYMNSDNIDGQISSSGDFKTFKSVKHKEPVKVYKAGGQMLTQYEIAIKKITTNTVFIMVDYKYKGEQKHINVRGLGLYNRDALFTKHELCAIINLSEQYKNNIITDLSIKVRPFDSRGSSSVEDLTVDLVLNEYNFKFITNYDLGVVVMPNRMPQFQDITNFIATSIQHSQNYRDMVMLTTSKKANLITTDKCTITQRVKKTEVAQTSLYEQIDSWNSYLYDKGAAGDCGSIGLVDANSPILLFHHAGNVSQKQGFGVPLIREDIIKFKENKVPWESFYPTLLTGQGKVELTGKIWKVGTVPKEQIPYLSEKTKIIPSLLNGNIENTEVITQPGILSSRDKRYTFEGSPLQWGCMKHTNPPKDLPFDLIEIATNNYLGKLLKHCKPIRILEGPLDMITAVAGINGIDYYDPMKLNTSSGYPFNLNTHKTKESLIQVVRNEHGDCTEVKIHKSLLETIELKQKLRSKGIRPFTVFQDTLKDERRKPNKLKKKDGTRVFSQSPVDYTIETRQYTLDFAAAFMKYRMNLEHAVGISVNSPEWALLVEKLMQKGNNIISGDFTDYGPRIFCQLVIAAGKLINEWYEHYAEDKVQEKENSKIRTILFEEIAHCYHICNDLIYMTYCGIPSGHPLTTILNTIVQSLLLRIVWMIIMQEHNMGTMTDFDNHVCLISYGDDHLISITNEIKELFNCTTIGECLKQFDFIYTDANKTGNVKYTGIEEATFLKCGFKPHPVRRSQFLAPIDEISITECAQWVFKSADLESATIENAEQSLRLSYGHGKDYFNEWKRKLNNALKKKDLPILTLTWEECDELFFYGIDKIIMGKFVVWNTGIENVTKENDTFIEQYFMVEEELKEVVICPESNKKLKKILK